MAKQVAALVGGADYQHLCSSNHVLELLMPRKQVVRVRVEDEDAVSADDVTVRHADGCETPDRFVQIKYHVDQSGHYSTEFFIAKKGTESSLLKKLYRSWDKLRKADPTRPFVIELVSNWAWDSADKVKTCFGEPDNALTAEFFAATNRMDVGQLREKLRAEAGASDADFDAFMKSLRFKLGFDCWHEMKRRVSERMDFLGLKSDESALFVATGIVREWIKRGPQDLTHDVLTEVLKKHDLYLPPEREPAVHVYLMSIKNQKYDIEPDHLLDWRGYFVGSEHKRGHELKNPADWNGVLLPELEAFERKINTDTACRLIRARGQARLSPWIAFGYAFSAVNRYTIEVDQNGALWRTDAEPSPDFRLHSNAPDGEVFDGSGTTVAVGVSVTGDLAADVRQDLANRKEQVAALLLVQPERPLGIDCLRGEGDAVALATGVKALAGAFAKRWNATKLRFYYYGPLGGAAFIGHQFSNVCRELQVMENLQPGYAPSFLLG